MRLGGSGLLTQLYVGKPPISKRDQDSIRKFMVLAFHGPCSCAPKYPRQSTIVHDRRHPHVGPVREAAAIVLQQSPELPIFSQNALMPFAGDPTRFEKMVGHHKLFRIFTGSLGRPHGNSAVVGNLISEGDGYGE